MIERKWLNLGMFLLVSVLLMQFVLSIDIDFTLPTPADGANTSDSSVVINVSITNASALSEAKINWNGTNYTIYNDSLVLMMNFDNVSSIGDSSSNVVDVSRSSNNGTLTNGAVCNVSVKFGKAAYFDGVNDQILLNRTISFSSSDRWTAAFWARSYASDAHGMVMGDNSDTADFIWLYSGNYFRFRNSAGTSADFNITNFSGINYYVLVANGTAASVYLNGVYNSTVAITTTFQINSIGQGYNSNNYVFKGWLDEVRVWNRTLSADEIGQNYHINLRKYDSDKWWIYYNKTGLTNGTYTYYAYSKDSDSSENLSAVRTLIFGDGSAQNDTTAPAVSLDYPTDGQSLTSTNNITLNASATDTIDLDNCTLWTNISGAWAANETKVFSGTSDSDSWSFYNLSNATYKWNAYCCDNSSNCAWSATNFSFSVAYSPYVPPAQNGSNSTFEIQFVAPTPANNTMVNAASALINISVNSSALNELKLNWNGTNYTHYDSSLVLMYNFDNVSAIGESATKAVDASRNSFNGTLSGNAAFTTGKYGSALTFDGASDYVLVGNQTPLGLINTDFTVMLWVYPNALGTIRQLIGTGSNEAVGRDWEVLTYTSNNLLFYIGTSYATSDTNSLTTGQWQHVAVVFNDTDNTCRFYVNGNFAGNGSGLQNVTSIGHNLTIGIDPRDLVGYDFNGKIDEVRVWNRSFSASEINPSYNSNLNKYTPDSWALATNQTELVNATYSYYAYAKDASNNENSTETRLLNVNVSSSETNSSNSSSGTISITYPTQYVLYQRDALNKSDITVYGTYTGSPSSIEARFNSGAWQTIVASPAGGSFRGNLTNQSLGQGRLEVRFSTNASVNSSVTYIGIGDIYAIAGQSNAEMRGTNSQSLNSSNIYNATVYREDDAWTIANDPVDTGTSIGSSWPLLANYIIQETNVPVAYISSSTGGTSILSWQKGQSLYTSLINQIRDATNGTMRVKGIIWYQGENDVVTDGGCQGNYAWYKANLTKFANDLANDTNSEGKLIVGQINYWVGGTRATSDNIKSAQQDLWDENSNISVGVTTYDIAIADNVHYKSNAELQKFADRWWAALQSKFYGGSCSRIRIQSAEFNTATNKLTLTFNSSAPIVNGSGSQGWRINDGAATLTDSNITSATVTGNYTIELTLDRTIGTGANLTLGSYSDCWSKNVLNFSCDITLPPEMILNFPITIASMTASFVSPTEANGSTINTTYNLVNVSLSELNYPLNEFIFNWNGTNSSFYDGSLISMFNFDNISAIGENATKSVDLSAYKNNASLINGASLSQAGKYGGALALDGANDYAKIQNGSLFNFGTKDFTIETWIKTNSNTGQGIVSKTDPSGSVDSSDGFAVFLSDSSLVRVRAQSLAISAESTGNITAEDGWTHLAVVADRDGNLTIYKNGANIGSTNISSGASTSITSSYDMKIGLVRASHDDYFNGSIDKLKIYNKTLSSSEVMQHYYGNLYKYSSTSWAFYTNQSNLPDGNYTCAVYARDSNSTVYNTLTRTFYVIQQDLTAPAAVTNLANQSAGSSWIYWNWTNPADSDFNVSIVYISEVNVANVSVNYYNATGLNPSTSYAIRINTKDSSGNINYTNVSSSAITASGSDTTAPSVQLTSPLDGASLSAGTTSYSLSVVTDETAVCRYNTSDTAWENMSAMDTTNSTLHSLNITGLSNGNTYDYYFLCEDDEASPNRMSSSYHLQFSVASTSSGGGGGGGSRRVVVVNNTNSSESNFEFGMPGITIDSLGLIAVNPGETRKMSVNVKNSGTAYLNKCKLEVGGNYSWLVSSGMKDLSIGQMSEFVAELKIPDEAEPGSYSIEFSINCSELSESSKLDVEIIKKKLILELTDADRDKNGDIAISYSLAEMTGETQEVSVELVMLDSRGARVAEATEQRVIEPHSRTRFDSLLNLGEDVSGGNFNLLINANSKIASAFVQEYVVFDRKSISGLAIFGEGDKISKIIIAVTVAGFLVFAFFMVRRIFHHKRTGEKRKISSVLTSHFRPIKVG